MRTMILLVISMALLNSCGMGMEKNSLRSRDLKLPETANATTQPNSTGLTSIEAFSKTLYPILKTNCQMCHAKTITPFFASEDASIAHEALISTKKVNLENVPASRLIARLSVDKHNCWSGDCEADSKTVSDAITAWKTSLKAEATAPVATIVSGELKLADAIRRAPAASPGTIALEAEAGTLRAPMAMLNDANASGGRYVQAPNNANATLVAGDPAAGALNFTIDIAVPGTYKVWARVMAPRTADSSFFISVDGATPVAWVIPVAAGWQWDAASDENGAKDLTFALNKGSHTISITQRQDGTSIDRIVVTDNAAFNGTTPTADVNILKFDISNLVGGAQAYVEIEISDFVPGSYKFKNLGIYSTKALKVGGIHIGMNGHVDPQHATYSKIEADIAPPGRIVSTSALVILQEKGAAEDKFSISFEVLE